MKRYPFNKLRKAPTYLQAFRGTFLLQLLHKHTHPKQSTPTQSRWLQSCPLTGFFLRIIEKCCCSITGDIASPSDWNQSEIQRANCEIYLVTLVLSQYCGRDRIFGLCAGLCSCAHTSVIIVPRRKKTQKTFLYNPSGTESVQMLIDTNIKLKAFCLSTSFSCMLAAASVLDACAWELKNQ